MDVAGKFASYNDKEYDEGEKMPKKSKSAKASKPQKAHSPKQGRAQKSSRGERPGKAVGRKKNNREGGGGQEKRNREIKPAASNDKAFDAIGKLAGGKKSKDGCLPKVFMLFLPFVAVGTYFFLKS
jgi:hypothetical protein